MLSASNDNQQFLVRVELKTRSRATVSSLRFQGRQWEGGVGRGEHFTEALFEVDRATAVSLAKASSVELCERQPLDGELGCQWSFPREVTDGSPALVSLRIENHGAAPVVLMLPHSPFYAFALDAQRDGATVRVLGPFMFTGPSTFVTIAPGASRGFEVDLRSWLELTPGELDVGARFGCTLLRGGVERSAAIDSCAVWDFIPGARGLVRIAGATR